MRAVAFALLLAVVGCSDTPTYVAPDVTGTYPVQFADLVVGDTRMRVAASGELTLAPDDRFSYEVSFQHPKRGAVAVTDAGTYEARPLGGVVMTSDGGGVYLSHVNDDGEIRFIKSLDPLGQEQLAVQCGPAH